MAGLGDCFPPQIPRLVSFISSPCLGVWTWGRHRRPWGGAGSSPVDASDASMMADFYQGIRLPSFITFAKSLRTLILCVMKSVVAQNPAPSSPWGRGVGRRLGALSIWDPRSPSLAGLIVGPRARGLLVWYLFSCHPFVCSSTVQISMRGEPAIVRHQPGHWGHGARAEPWGEGSQHSRRQDGSTG